MPSSALPLLPAVTTPGTRAPPAYAGENGPFTARTIASVISDAVCVLITRRSDTEEPWLRVVRLPRARSGPRAGAHVERMFRGTDLSDRGPGKPAEGVSLRVRRRWSDGAWADDEALLVCDDGIQFRLPADGDARRLVELGLLEPAD